MSEAAHAADPASSPERAPSRFPAIPLRPQWRPTLPELLAPRWRRVPRRGQRAAIAGGVLLLALIAGGVLAILPPGYSRGGSPSFSFTYRGLSRAPAPPGAYVQVRRLVDGRLDASFVVDPLELPPYPGSVTGELPFYAAGLIRDDERADPGFQLTGEGKSRINMVAGYSFTYVTVRAGETFYGREILLLPNVPSVRRGVLMLLLERPGGKLTSSTDMGLDGVLQNPVRSFQI